MVLLARKLPVQFGQIDRPKKVENPLALCGPCLVCALALSRGARIVWCG